MGERQSLKEEDRHEMKTSFSSASLHCLVLSLLCVANPPNRLESLKTKQISLSPVSLAARGGYGTQLWPGR